MGFLIKPLEGIYFEDKSILLRDSIENVLKACGNNCIKSIDKEKVVLYFFHSELQICFDTYNQVEFIRFGGGYNIDISVSIYGIDPFKTTESELFALLKEKNNGDIGDTDDGYSYEFKNISVCIWREVKPENLAGFIEEINSDKSIPQDIKDENIREEIIKSSYWETLGIGIENYSA